MMEGKGEEHKGRFSTACFMGACVVDLITYTPRFPKPGETLSGTGFGKGFGGKAANAAVMSTKLGLPVKMLAKVRECLHMFAVLLHFLPFIKLGKDSFGEEYMNYLKSLSINTGMSSDNGGEHLEHDELRDLLSLRFLCPNLLPLKAFLLHDVHFTQDSYTPVASICVIEDGQNAIVYVPGTANCLLPSDLESRADALFKGIKLFVSTFECKPETLLTALKLAKKRNITTLVNAAPPFPSSFDKSLFTYCDILCLNESETETLIGTRIKSLEDGKASIAKLIELGCLSVIITLGEKGALFLKRGETEIVHATARPVSPVDTTGAGDAFLGALAYYLVEHPKLEMKEALRRACDIATTSTLKSGTQKSYPDKVDLPMELFI